MLKKLFKIGMFAGLLIFACNANAQDRAPEYPRYGFWSNWSLGGSVSYTWEYAHGGIFDWRQGSNVGIRLFAEKELNHVFAVRFFAETPGLFPGKDSYPEGAYNRVTGGDAAGFDRYGKMGVDFKFSINNALKGYDPERKGSFYAFLGSGFTFSRDDVPLGFVGLMVQGGLGYSYKVCDHSTIFAEIYDDISADIANPIRQWHDNTGMIALGYMYNFGATVADMDMIAQRQSLTQDNFDALTNDNADLNNKLQKANQKISELESQLEDCRNGVDDPTGTGRPSRLSNRECCAVADSLRKVIENYTGENRYNYYGMPFSILYGVDEATVPADQMNKVKAIADILKNDESINIEIVGYCDYSGSDDYNQRLSEKRAENVKKLLVNKYGIDEDRITVGGKGKTMPFGDIRNAINRRVSFYRVNK